jgi:hypothetical protein
LETVQRLVSHKDADRGGKILGAGAVGRIAMGGRPELIPQVFQRSVGQQVCEQIRHFLQGSEKEPYAVIEPAVVMAFVQK